VDSADDLRAALDRAIVMLDGDRQNAIEHVSQVIRDIVRVANKRSPAAGDLALVTVVIERARGPL
jgi:hypothetical protein